MRDFVVGNIAVGVIIVDGKDGSEAAFTDRVRLNIALERGEVFYILHRLKTRSPLARRFGEEATFPNTMAGGAAGRLRQHIV